MKRLVWLILAVFCTALAQVQPVELEKIDHADCACCTKSGPCQMPGCCPPPVTSSRTTASTLRAVAKVAPARRQATAARRAEAKFYESMVPAATVRVISLASQVTPAASVPLFKAHCSFLI